MSAIEQEIIEKVKRLDEQQKVKVLEFIQHFEVESKKSDTLDELRKMPPDERNRAVMAALQRAQNQDVEYFDVYTAADFDDE